jgi:hypothetical protein
MAAAIFAVAALMGALATARLAVAASRTVRRNSERNRLRRTGVEVAGTVIENLETDPVPRVRGRTRGPVGFRPVVRYTTVRGEELTETDIEVWPDGFPIGHSLVIAYNPDHPRSFTPARGRPGTRASFLISLTILLGLLTLVAAFFAVRLASSAAGLGFDLPGVDVPGVVLPTNR